MAAFLRGSLRSAARCIRRGRGCCRRAPERRRTAADAHRRRCAKRRAPDERLSLRLVSTSQPLFEAGPGRPSPQLWLPVPPGPPPPGTPPLGPQPPGPPPPGTPPPGPAPPASAAAAASDLVAKTNTAAASDATSVGSGSLTELRLHHTCDRKRFAVWKCRERKIAITSRDAPANATNRIWVHCKLVGQSPQERPQRTPAIDRKNAEMI